MRWSRPKATVAPQLEELVQTAKINLPWWEHLAEDERAWVEPYIRDVCIEVMADKLRAA